MLFLGVLGVSAFSAVKQRGNQFQCRLERGKDGEGTRVVPALMLLHQFRNVSQDVDATVE
jgi:hypothetical protein